MILKVAVWNAEWAQCDTERGNAVLATLTAGNFDVICLTEAYEKLLPAEGHLIASAPDCGYPLRPGRRKVLLWSRSTWRNVDLCGDANMPPGRFATGITLTPVGDVRVVGVCVPWKDAHVRTGQRNREPWEDHLAFLRALDGYLKSTAGDMPTTVIGDFNQRIPRTRAPLVVAQGLQRALLGFEVPTAGEVPPLGGKVIDHVAHDHRLIGIRVQGWPGTRADGLYLSDHDGVSVELALRSPA